MDVAPSITMPPLEDVDPWLKLARSLVDSSHARAHDGGVVGSLVYLSSLGRAVAPSEASVSAFDRGFLYGDSVYETLRTSGGEPVALAEHLHRLELSAEGILMQLPFSKLQLTTAMRSTVEAAKNLDSKVRVVVTRGGGPMALDTRKSHGPLLVIYVEPLVTPAPEEYERGLAAVIVDYRGHNRDMFAPSLKTGNYLPSILALRAAIDQKADDAIMVNAHGHVAEAAASNIFMVSEDVLTTPSLDTGVLSGITRQTVLRLARELGLSVQERAVLPEELHAAAEVFLTSSVRGVMPVTRLDNRVVGEPGPDSGHGHMGVATRRIHQAYEAWLAKIARGGVDGHTWNLRS
jgi:branched-chain amino acid aminotransferase